MKSNYAPNATYTCAITGAGLVESSKGTPGIEVVMENATAGTITHRLWLTPKAIDRTKGILEEFGVTPEGFAAFLDGNAQRLVGQTATIETELDTYEGEDRVRVKWFNGPNRKPRGAKAATPKALAAARALLGVPASDDVPF